MNREHYKKMEDYGKTGERADKSQIAKTIAFTLIVTAILAKLIDYFGGGGAEQSGPRRRNRREEEKDKRKVEKIEPEGDMTFEINVGPDAPTSDMGGGNVRTALRNLGGGADINKDEKSNNNITTTQINSASNTMEVTGGNVVPSKDNTYAIIV